MFALIWGAVRTRTAQVLTVLILTALATAVAAAGPWFAVAAANRAAAADVAAAPPEQLSLSVRKIADTSGDPLRSIQSFGNTVRDLLRLPVSAPVNGLVLPLTAGRGGDTTAIAIGYRDDFCGHLVLDGPCPTQPRQATVSRSAAQQLGVAAGDRLPLRASPSSDPVELTVVSTYAFREPGGAYWSNPLFAAENGLDPVLTPMGTFEARELSDPTISYDVRVPPELILGERGDHLLADLRAADLRLGQSQLRLVNTTGLLLDTIARDRAAIRRGVLVAMGQILVLAWFAIGLTGRYTGRDRRGDAALLKLRGGTRAAILRLAWGQHLVPLVFGALVGLPLGYLLARLFAGPAGTAAEQRTALLLAVAAAGAVLLGGLLVLAVVEAFVLRQPVAALLRQVGVGRGDWRAGVVDLLLLALATAAVYQARSGAPGTGLALAAPALVALAVALLLARLLGRVADRGGGAAVRTGHLRLGLTAVQVSRQPGTDRVFALVVVAVAVFATALGGWAGERTGRTERSTAELGAVRVLRVQAANRTALLEAVRRADPSGAKAMAVTVDRASNPPVLAVDSGRLAAVARWRPEFGPVGTLPAAAAAAAGPATGTPITGDRLAVRARYDGDAPVELRLRLQHEGTGVPVRVEFGALRRGEQTLTAPVDGCTAAPGCRILRWELTDSLGGAPPNGTTVTLRNLSQQNPPAVVLDAAGLGDIARWRAGTIGAAVDLTAAGGVLRLAVDRNEMGAAQVGDAAWAVDTGLPLPVVLAGPPSPTWQFADPLLYSFGSTPVPVRVVGSVAALPVLGRSGVLVDLEATRRLIGDASPAAEFQVWLAGDAGPGIVPALAAAGVTVSGDVTAGDRAGRLAEQGPAVGSRFALLAGAVALLLAAAAIGVAGAVDRRPRIEQLRSLRLQGLGRRAAVVTAYAGTAVLVGTGLLAGLVAAALARPLARVAVPPFTDGWDVLPAPSALTLPALAVAGLAGLVVLGLTGWLSVLPLIRHLRSDGAR